MFIKFINQNKNILLKSKCEHSALGVPSSPAAAGASPRRSQGRLTPEAKYFSLREMLNLCYAKAKYALLAS